jgi:dihydrofolate reductase
MNSVVASPESPVPLGIVVAMTRSGVIGLGGRLPWDLPADRQLFRRLTIGNTVIMGRRTFESLPGALPGRHNLVVSRSSRELPGAAVCPTLGAALAAGRRLQRPLFVIGGRDLYREALPLADFLHVSWVEGDCAGDRFFPEWEHTGWIPVYDREFPGFRYICYQRAAG